MRKQLRKILKEHFSDSVLHKRDELGITQEQMASLLSMECRSYADLESGKRCCGTLTLIIYVFFVCNDRVFLDELHRALEEEVKNFKY